MSDEKTADVLRKLDVLKTRFREKASGDINLIELMAMDAAAGRGGQEEVRRAYQVLHRLAGSAGTFGFRALGEEARALELVLKPYLESETGAPGDLSEIHEMLLNENFIGRVRGLESLLAVEESEGEATETPKDSNTDSAGQPEVLIIEPEQTSGEYLANLLVPHGFSVQCATPRELFSKDLSRISVVLIRDDVLIAQEQIPWPSQDRPPSFALVPVMRLMNDIGLRRWAWMGLSASLSMYRCWRIIWNGSSMKKWSSVPAG